MTNLDFMFAAWMLSLTALLFGGLYLRDIMRIRLQSGVPSLPGCTRLPLQAGACFFASFVVLSIEEAIVNNTRVHSILLGLPFTVIAFVLAGYGFTALFRWVTFLGVEMQEEQNAILDEMALCMERGLPIDGLLDAFAKERRSQMLYYASGAANRLREGAPLSAALATRTMLPPHAVASIQAGERSGGGTLPVILRRISSEFRGNREHQSALKISLTYVTLLTLAVVPILRFQLAFIFPKLTEIVTVLSRRLNTLPMAPWMPSLINILDYGSIILFVILVVLFWTIEGAQSPMLGDRRTRIADALRQVRLQIYDRIPLLRQRMRHECLARIANVMSGLVAAKVPLQTAARGASHQDIAGPYSPNLLRFSDAVDEGRSINEALTLSQLPTAFTIFFQAGENSADLDKALRLAAEFEQTKKARIDRQLTVVIPLILLPAIAAMVAGSYIGTMKALNEIIRSFTP